MLNLCSHSISYVFIDYEDSLFFYSGGMRYSKVVGSMLLFGTYAAAREKLIDIVMLQVLSLERELFSLRVYLGNIEKKRNMKIALTKAGVVTQEVLDEGETFKGANNIAFEDREEAEDWGVLHYGHGAYDLLELCEDCEDGSYRDEPSNKYKTRKRIIKRVKILKIL